MSFRDDSRCSVENDLVRKESDLVGRERDRSGGSHPLVPMGAVSKTPVDPKILGASSLQRMEQCLRGISLYPLMQLRSFLDDF